MFLELVDLKQWEPLWKNRRWKTLDRDKESRPMAELLYLANLKEKDVDLVLDHEGNKYVRLKVYRGLESFVETYHYKMYGPLIFTDGKIHMRKTVVNDKSISDGRPLLNKKIESILVATSEIACMMRVDAAALKKLPLVSKQSQA